MPLASGKELLKAEGCTKSCKSIHLFYFLCFLFYFYLCSPDFSTSGPSCVIFHQDFLRYKPREDNSPPSEITFFFSNPNSHIQPMTNALHNSSQLCTFICFYNFHRLYFPKPTKHQPNNCPGSHTVLSHLLLSLMHLRQCFHCFFKS